MDRAGRSRSPRRADPAPGGRDGGVVHVRRRDRFGPGLNVLSLVAVACYAVIGGLIAARLPGNACGWLLLLIGLGLVVSIGADAVTTVALRDGRPSSPWALWVNSWLLVVTAWPGTVLYLLVFPSGLLPSCRWRPFVFGLLALSALGVGARMAQTWEGEPITYPSRCRAASIADTLFRRLPGLRCGAILAVVSVVLRFRRASPDDRQALRWLVFVGVLSASLLVVAIGAGALGRSDR